MFSAKSIGKLFWCEHDKDLQKEKLASEKIIEDMLEESMKKENKTKYYEQFLSKKGTHSFRA